MIRSAMIKKDFALVLLTIVILSILTVVLTLRGHLGKTDANPSVDTTEATTEQDKDKDKPKEVTTASGLKYIDMTEGTGAKAESGSRVQVHYTGWLKNGKKFDSSKDRGEPFSFVLGKGEVIPGWDEGVKGMKVGGKRKLIIPYQLAYGERGQGPIPPKSELTFEVELLAVNR